MYQRLINIVKNPILYKNLKKHFSVCHFHLWLLEFAFFPTPNNSLQYYNRVFYIITIIVVRCLGWKKLQNLTVKNGNGPQKSVCLDFLYSDFDNLNMQGPIKLY